MKSLSCARLFSRALCLVVALSLAGCQTTGTSNSFTSFFSSDAREETDAEKELRADQKRFSNTVISGVLTGAVTGAVLGALSSLLLGGGKRDVALAAGVGALAGGTMTGVDAYMTAKREQAGRDSIRMAMAAAEDVERDNNNLQQYLASSERVLNEGTARLAALKQDLDSNKIEAKEADRLRKQEEKNIASMEATLADARKTRDQYQQASAQIDVPAGDKQALDLQINRMDQQINQLERNVAAYAEALAVSRA